MRNIFRRSTEFAEKHKHHHHLFLAVLALAVAGTGVYTFRQEIVQAATYTIFQTSWGGTVGGGTVTHSPDGNNQTSWDGYSSASSTISVSANDASLLSAPYYFTDDGTTSGDSLNASGGGFTSTSAIKNQTVVNGSGSSANIGLGIVPETYDITARTTHSCALKSDGTVFCWGQNNYGQLGNNTTVNTTTPVQVLGVGGSGFLTGVSNISHGTNFSCALKSDGTVFCWGQNNASGQLGNNTITTSYTPVQVLGVGGSGFLTGVSEISAGNAHVCAVKSDGTAYCWGEAGNYQLGHFSSTDSYTPVQIHGVSNVGYLTGVSKISATTDNTCAVKTDGTAYCWGLNTYGRLGDNTTTIRSTPVQVHGVGNVGMLTGVADISSVDTSSCAVKSDGTAYCWGLNTYGQLGDNTVTQRNTPVQVLGVGASGFLTDVSKIAGGGYLTSSAHRCAIKSDGTVFCWGSNLAGELGNNTTTTSYTPVQVLGVGGSGFLTGVGKISGGNSYGNVGFGSNYYGYNCAAKTDGTAYCWGGNLYGRFGNNTTNTYSATPLQVHGVGDAGMLSLFTPTYYSSGTFTSNTIDFYRPTIFTTMSWAATLNGHTITMKARTSADGFTWTDWGSCGTIVSGAYFTTASPNCVTNEHQYMQYQATLNGDTVSTPALESVTINDTQYSADGGALISSKYDSGDATNQVSKVTWTGSATSTNETIKFQVRTASSAGGLDSAPWCGYADTGTCTGSNYFEYTHSGVSITDTSHPLRSGENDEFVQYRVVFASGGAISPILDDVTVQYVVNAAPVVTITTPTVSQASDGTVTVTYDLVDSDTVQPPLPYSGKADVTLQYCTGSCPDGSETWVDAISAAVSGTGVGSGVTLGTGKSITWTPALDPSTASLWKPGTQKIRIKAYDGEGANHTGYSSASNTFILDTTPPVISSAVIDSSAGASTASGNTAGTITLTITDNSTKQYRLCNNIAFPDTDAQGNTCTWTTPLASTISGEVISSWVFTGANAAETVYIQARDFYNNTSAVRTNTAPAMPTDLRVADVSNPAADSFGETSSWVSVDNATSYDVEFATSVTEAGPAGSYTLRASPTSNIYPHSITVATTSAHWYRVRAVNANGDKSNFVTVTGGDIPNGFGTALPDSTAPTIESSSVPTIKNTSANIIFVTNELAIGQVYWGEGTTANTGTCTTATTPTTTYATSTSVWLSGLTSLTDYVYCFKVTDVLGNPSAILPGGTFRTVGGPVITNVTEREITDTSAVIFWNTSTSSTSWVKYAETASGVTNGTSVGSDTMVSESPTLGVFQHQVGLGVDTQLTAGQTYYFQVTSTNSDGTTTDTNNGQYYKFVTLLDTSPPTITGTSTPVLASNAAVVVWQTSEPADGQLFFDTSNHGTDTSLYPKYTQSQTPATSIKSIFHVMTLSSDYTNYGSGGGNLGLVKETPYYYVVKSSDTAGNIARSAGTFTTPSDGNVTVTVVAVSVAAPAGTTPDTTSPTVSNVKISDITPFGATVKFDTDEDADGFAEYGKDVKYGDTAGDKTFAKTHTIKLRGLTLGTDYHIKVTAHDKAGNTGTSADQTFKTSFLSEDLKDLAKIENIEAFQKEIENTIESILPSLVPPFIAKPIISDITESGATVTFKSNIKAFPVVVFAEDGAYDETKDNPYTGEVSDTAEKATAHSLKLTGLKGNTKYHVQARGFSLPKVIGKSADVTFITKASKIAGSIVERKKDSFTVVWTTEQPTSSIVEYKDLKRGITGRKTDDAKKKSHSMKIENLPPGTAYEVNLSGLTEQGNVAEAGSPLSVTTSTDTTPPIISGFKVDNALVPGRTDRIQTIVSWVTDEPSTSTAFYEEGAGAPGDTEELASKNEILDSYVTNHSVILPSLKPGTIYRLKVTSSDDSGNLGSFGPRTVITPKQTESITDIIFKNFEDSFKFLQKI